MPRSAPALPFRLAGFEFRPVRAGCFRTEVGLDGRPAVDSGFAVFVLRCRSFGREFWVVDSGVSRLPGRFPSAAAAARAGLRSAGVLTV